MSVKGSVGAKVNGRRADNLPNDVTYVRSLLNFHILFNSAFKNENFTVLPIPMFVDQDMTETIRAISTYQMYMMKVQQPSGRIDPHDATIKALVLGDVPGMPRPDTHAPIADRIHNKLLRVKDNDFLAFYDQNGEIEKMIDMLLENKNADDGYIRHMYLNGNDTEVQDYRLENYIKNPIAGVTTPGPIDFLCSVKGRIEEGMEMSQDNLTRLVARIAGEIRAGYSGYFVCDAKHSLNLSPSTTGPYAASKNVEEWFKTKFADRNSIYSCFPSILTDTEYH